MKTIYNKLLIICALSFLFVLPLHAVQSDELVELRKKAALEKTVDNYLDVCNYCIDYVVPLPVSTIEAYLDSARTVALQTKALDDLAAYYTMNSVFYYMQDSLLQFKDNAEKSLTIYEKLGSYPDMSSCYSNIGLYYNCIGKYKKEREYLHKGLGLIKRYCPDNSDHELILSNMAISYLYDGLYTKGLYYASEAYKQATLQKDTAIMIEALNTQGVIYRRQSQVDKCVDKLKTALWLSEETGQTRKIPIALLNICVAYNQHNRPEEAFYFAERARSSALKAGDNRSLWRIYNEYKTIYVSQHKYDVAVDSLKKGLIYAFLDENPVAKAEVYTALSELYSKMGKQDSAKKYAYKTNELLVKEKNSLSLEAYYRHKANVAFVLNNYQDAILFNKKLLEFHRANNKNSSQYIVYERLASGFANTGDYAKAYHYLDSAYNQRNYVYDEDMKTKLADFSVQYKTEEKELEITRLKQKELEQETSNMQRKIYYLGGFIVLLVLFGALLYSRQHQKSKYVALIHEAQKRDREFISLQKDAELRLTRKYIDGQENERLRLSKVLHDNISNELLAIKLQLENGISSRKNILDSLQKLHTEIRCVSHDLMPPVFKYVTLPEILQDYVCQHTQSGSTNIAFEHQSNVGWDDFPQEISLEIYRMVQEVTSNALKHSNASLIEISLSRENNKVKIMISDNGKGFDKDKKLHRGIGLNIVEERVDNLKGKLTINSILGKGTTIIIEFEL